MFVIQLASGEYRAGGGEEDFLCKMTETKAGNTHHKFTFLLYLFAIGLVLRFWVNINWVKISTQQLQKIHFSDCYCKEDNCPTYVE